jgi:hypothetical protein
MWSWPHWRCLLEMCSFTSAKRPGASRACALIMPALRRFG